MNLYLLRRTDSVGYDEYDGFVIRAENPANARKIAGRFNDSFFDNTHSDCELVNVDGDEGIILDSFQAG